MHIDERVGREKSKLLTNFINTSFEKDDFISSDVLMAMCFVAETTNFQVDVFVDRKNVVTDVFVWEGNRSFVNCYKSNVDGKGLRMFHTTINPNAEIHKNDKDCIKNYGFDSVCAVSYKNSAPYSAQVLFNFGDEYDVVKVLNTDYINKHGLKEKLLEATKRQAQKFGFENIDQKPKAVLVMAELTKQDNAEQDLIELEGLAITANIDVVAKLSQKRTKPDPATLIGKGKLEELLELIKEQEADLVIFDNELTGSKLSNLQNELGVKVIDRSMLILDIFAMRASTNEGKLQVELAQLKHSLPRLNSYAQTENRYGGGVGMRGPGETKLELKKRVVLKRIQQKEEELLHAKKTRNTNRQNRQNSKKRTIAIVGYTNSGKSTLMNLLTKENVYVKDQLFATLDTTTRNWWIGDNTEALLVDTVGFINKLPHEFIEAFSSTLEETAYADLLVHVVDLSNPDYLNQIEVCNQVLKKLGANAKMIMVYNKIDKVADKELIDDLTNKGAICISAYKNLNIDKLKALIVKEIKKITK